LKKKEFFPYYQTGLTDCGPTCLLMISKYHKKDVDISTLRRYCNEDINGVNLLGLVVAAKKIGFSAIAVHVNVSCLMEDVPLPCIIHWNKNHFVVLYKIFNTTFYIANPENGLIKYEKELFLNYWCNGEHRGIVIVISN